MNMFEKIGEFKPDSLIVSGDVPILKDGCGLKSGQGILKRGSLIVKDAAGDYVLAPKAGATPDAVFGILTDDTDTGDTADAAKNIPAVCYTTGIFNPDAVVVATEATVNEYADAMKTVSLFLRGVQKYE